MKTYGHLRNEHSHEHHALHAKFHVVKDQQYSGNQGGQPVVEKRCHPMPVHELQQGCGGGAHLRQEQGDPGGNRLDCHAAAKTFAVQITLPHVLPKEGFGGGGKVAFEFSPNRGGRLFGEVGQGVFQHRLTASNKQT